MVAMPNRVGFDNYIGSMPTSEIGGEISGRVSQWNAGLHRNGLIHQFRRNYRLYYNIDPYAFGYPVWDSYNIGGANGEYLKMRSNFFRNYIQHVMNMIFAKPPSLKGIASNSDGASLDAAMLFDHVLNEMFATQRANRQIKKAGEFGLVFGTGFALVEWDSMLGEPYSSKEDDSLVYDGGIRIRAKSPFDIYWDQGKEDWEDLDWVIVREFENKYRLAARFPDLADKIMAIESKDKMQRSLFVFDAMETDDIFVYKFYHKPVSQDFLPNGRYTMIAGNDLVLFDDANPYDGLPVFRLSPNEGLGTVYGYTPANDMAPLQMFNNLIMTSIASQISAHGVGSVAVEKGSDINPSGFAGGMNVVEYNTGSQPPQPLSLLALQPILPELSQILQKTAQQYMGLNSVVVGDPDSSLKSGRALAIVQSQAIQFSSGFQMSVVNFVEDIGNFMLRLLQKFATTPRMAQIVGEDQISEAIEWTGETMMKVARVRAEVVDPFTQTATGKLEKAEALLGAGFIRDAQHFLTLAETGNDEPLYDGPMAEIRLIREENRMIKNGQEPLIVNTDDHPNHITEHKTTIAHPQVRNNPQILQVALNHIMKHEMAMQGMQFDVMGNMLNQPAPPQQPGMDVMGPDGVPMSQEDAPIPQGGPEGQQMPMPGLAQISGPTAPMAAQPLAQ